jgi:hypothetical protein
VPRIVQTRAKNLNPGPVGERTASFLASTPGDKRSPLPRICRLFGQAGFSNSGFARDEQQTSVSLQHILETGMQIRQVPRLGRRKCLTTTDARSSTPSSWQCAAPFPGLLNLARGRRRPADAIYRIDFEFQDRAHHSYTPEKRNAEHRDSHRVLIGHDSVKPSRRPEVGVRRRGVHRNDGLPSSVFWYQLELLPAVVSTK